MAADVLHRDDPLAAADDAVSWYCSALFEGNESLPESYFHLVVIHIVVILFPEYLFVPFELFEQEKAPPPIEINQHLDIFEDVAEFLKYFFKREDLIWFQSVVIVFTLRVIAGVVIAIVFGVIVVVVIFLVVVIITVIVFLLLHRNSIKYIILISRPKEASVLYSAKHIQNANK